MQGDELVFLDYYKLRAYVLSSRGYSLKRVVYGREARRCEKRAVGYAVRYRGSLLSCENIFCGLGVVEGRLSLMVNGCTYDVLDDDVVCSILKVGFFSYVFSLKRGGEVVAKVPYREYFSSDPSYVDPPFFADVLFWLKNLDSKHRFMSLWSGPER